jgi:hypothetical protein
MLARWGVLFSEARWSQRVDPTDSHLSLRRTSVVTALSYNNDFSGSDSGYFCWPFGQSVLVSSSHLRPMTRSLLLSDICGLHVMRRPPWREDESVIYSYTSLSLSGPSPTEVVTTPYFLIWDSPNPEGQVPAFKSPKNSVAQLYHRALGSLFVGSCKSQGYGGDILTRLHTKLIIFQCQS